MIFIDNPILFLVVVIIFMFVTKHKMVLNKTIIINGIIISCTNTLYAVANKLTTAGNVIILEFTMPIFVIIISYASDNSILNNSYFDSCSAVFGGAVFCYGSTISLDNSIFNNCSVNSTTSDVNGGSILWLGANGKLTNSNFTNSKAIASNNRSSYGGAIHL